MLVDVALLLVAIPAVAWATYLGALALVSCAPVGAPKAPAHRGTKFDIIVPAHNEEVGIAKTVANLAAVTYPAEMRRVVVVADNCSDSTVTRATTAGAHVLERTDAAHRGKGYALEYAFDWVQNEGFADAVLVVDADTNVTSNILDVVDARLQNGARAVQVEYCVANPEASWRTRLMHIGFTLFHDVRSRARERLGVSTGLRGNGMAFSVSLLREVPHTAFSVVEDIEYGIRLGRAGVRVHYAGEAKVYGDMVSSEKASRSQRQRWEGGRLALAHRYGLPLFAEGLRRGDFLLLDLGADLLVPPLTYVAVALFGGAAGAAVWVALGHGSWEWFIPWAIALMGVGLYVARGVQLARVGPRAMLDLAWVPVYMVWKIALALGGAFSRPKEWVRTEREGESRD